MRALIFFFLGLFPFLSWGQSPTESKLDWGFRLAMNRSVITEKGGEPNGIEVNNRNGIEWAALLRVRIHEKWYFSQQLGISLNQGTLEYQSLEGGQNVYGVLPRSVDLASSITWSPGKERIQVSVGPKLQFPLFNRVEDSRDFPAAPNLGMEFALGFSLPVGSSTLLPELKYSMGLMNVSRLPLVQSVQLNTFSLGFIWLWT